MTNAIEMPNFLNHRNKGAIPSTRSIVTVKGIIDGTSKFFNVPVMELISNRRNANLVFPRHIAMYLAKKLTPYSLPTIGRRFGKDHTTIIHALRKVEIMMTTGNYTNNRRRMTHSPAEVTAIIAEVERKILSGDDEL